jgi:hypothetical protein
MNAPVHDTPDVDRVMVTMASAHSQLGGSR